MLTANRLQAKPGATIQTIAGKSSGKRILCSQQALAHYNKLLALSRHGNYWATLIVKSITGLNSGRLANDNIYIKQRTSIAYGTGDSFTDKPLKKTGAAAATGLTTAGVAFGFLGASLTTAGLVGVAGGLLTVSKAIISGAKNTKIQKY